MEYSQSMLLLLLLVSTVGCLYERSREDMYNQLMQMQQQHHEEQQQMQQHHHADQQQMQQHRHAEQQQIQQHHHAEQQQRQQHHHADQQQMRQQLQQIQQQLQQHMREQQQLQQTIQHVQEELKQQREHNAGLHGGCSDSNVEGLTTIYIRNQPIPVLCDGKGGIVILRVINDDFDFSGKTWNDHRQGFGNPSGTFWLGLEHIHQLTSLSKFALLFENKYGNGQVRVARYEYVQVMDDSSGYRLMVDGYSGNEPDVFFYRNGMKFTTIDRDNDEWIDGNCAKHTTVAWWHSKWCGITKTRREDVIRIKNNIGTPLD